MPAYFKPHIAISRHACSDRMIIGALAGLLAVTVAMITPTSAGEVASSSTQIQASGINPYLYVGKNRDELHAMFPGLSKRELDRLQFRIADIQSRESFKPSK